MPIQLLGLSATIGKDFSCCSFAVNDDPEAIAQHKVKGEFGRVNVVRGVNVDGKWKCDVDWKYIVTFSLSVTG